MQQELNENNVLMYAILNYENQQCLDINEFFSDFKKIKYIKQKFTQFEKDGTIKERLVLNYLILLYNVFEHQALTKILFFKIPDKHKSILKTFLVYMNHIENNDDGIFINEEIANILRKI